MSLHTVRRCDECGAMHGEANNWWCVVESAVQPRFITFAEAADRAYSERFRLDFCSHACVGTAFHRWLDTGSVVRQEVPVAVEERDEYAAVVF